MVAGNNPNYGGEGTTVAKTSNTVVDVNGTTAPLGSNDRNNVTIPPNNICINNLHVCVKYQDAAVRM